jgi:cytochrome c-type biogenesis protein
MLIFLAPCTLPLLPAYLGFLSGVTQSDMVQGVTRVMKRKIMRNALLFVCGFMGVFIVLGLLVGVAGAVLAPISNWLRIIGGVFVIFFGLFMLGVFNVSFLTKERRIRLPKFITIGSPISSFLLGAVFGVGWTPCNGPVLGAVLSFASTFEHPFMGALLLFVYALGFSVPFLILAMLFSHASRIVERLRPLLRGVSLVGGVVLVIMGIWMIFGHTFVTNWFFNLFLHFDLEAILMPYL